MEETEELKPTVELAQKRFWQTKKGVAALASPLALVLFIILMVILNYLDVIFLPLSSLPKKLSLSCPIKDQNCQQNTPVNLDNKTAAGYKLATASAVINTVKAVDHKTFVLAPFGKEDPIGLNQSFILGNTCYTITYTLPFDSKIASLEKLPLSLGTQLISIGSESIKLNNLDLNLILQVQKRPLGEGKTDQEKCPVYNLRSEEFGGYQQITPDLFKK